MSGRITIVGAGEADGGRASGRRGLELAAEAALRAADDAGLELEAIDGLVVEDPDTDQHHMAHLALADLLGVQPAFALSTACGGATPFANLGLAAMAIRSGEAGRILVVDYDARQLLRAGDRAARLARQGGHRNPWEDPYGPITMAKFALFQRAHMDRFGTTREQLAHVTVQARRNGSLRPAAQMKQPVTVEDVLASPPIAEPIHLLDCCIVSDWGSAVVVSGVDPPGGRAVEILGAGQGHEGYAVTASADLSEYPAIVRSGRRALGAAGISQADVDVALLYDSFTFTLLAAVESLGFCDPGEGGEFVASGRHGAEGSLPVNPHGGQLAYSGGHGHFVTEAVRQLRGEAPSGQVGGCRVALCQGTAAGLLSSYTVVLGRS